MKKELQHFISCLFNQNDHLVPQINETLTYYIIRQNKTPQILKLNVSTKKHLEHFNLNTLNISTENNLNITTENTLIISTENNLNITTKNTAKHYNWKHSEHFNWPADGYPWTLSWVFSESEAPSDSSPECQNYFWNKVEWTFN